MGLLKIDCSGLLNDWVGGETGGGAGAASGRNEFCCCCGGS